MVIPSSMYFSHQAFRCRQKKNITSAELFSISSSRGRRRDQKEMEGEAKKRWSLEGMTALVTGGTKGIGHAIVEELASFGASVYTCARTESDLRQRLEEWKESGLRVTGSICDVSCRPSREKLMEDVSSHFGGKLNILINNVGTSNRLPTVEVTAEHFSLIMRTNFESAYHLSQLAHPLLKASGEGSIVFVSSVAGVVALWVTTVYSATKGAMNQLTKNLACEWAKDKIRTNCVTPWVIKTPLADRVFKDKELADTLIRRTPLRRFGEAKDVSSLVAFLCLPAASYITGQVISIDGGFTINGFYPPDD